MSCLILLTIKLSEEMVIGFEFFQKSRLVNIDLLIQYVWYFKSLKIF